MKTLKDNMKHVLTLKKREDFVFTAKAGKKWVSPSVIVQIAKADHDRQRIGYTVTKKTFKSAVKRNRIKRRMRAAAADILSAQAQCGYDYVLIGRSDTLDVPYAQLCKDLRWCLKRLECLQ